MITEGTGKLSQGAVTTAGKDGPFNSTCAAWVASLSPATRPTNPNTLLRRNDLSILPSSGARVKGRFINFLLVQAICNARTT